MIELLFFLLGLIIGLLSGITFICLYFVKSVSGNSILELPSIKNEKKTAIMVTHDIAEAISMSDKVIIMSKRPGTVKKVIDINLDNKSIPTLNRKDKKFTMYYDRIWKVLDHHI